MEHLAAWQIAEFIVGGLDEDELEEVYRHLDRCGECVSWLAGVIRLTSESGARGRKAALPAGCGVTGIYLPGSALPR